MNTSIIPLSRFEQALVAANLGNPRKKSFLAAKVILVLATLLLSAISIPRQATENHSMTAEILLEVINQDRARYALPALRANEKLAAAARAKALDILENNYFDHTSPTGVEPWDFIKRVGFPYSFAGENLAINYTSSYELEKDFLASPRHRENLLSPLFSEVGIAVAAGEYQGKHSVITVQIFAAPHMTLTTYK